MRTFTALIVALVIMTGCATDTTDFGMIDSPNSESEFFNSLSGQYMKWIECGGTDDIGELPVASFWAGEDDDWIGAAFAFWFPQGRCTGYPDSCDINCISDESGLLPPPSDYAPIDDIQGAGAASPPIEDPGIEWEPGPGSKHWACDGWKVFLIEEAPTISFWMPGGAGYAIVVSTAIEQWNNMNVHVSCPDPYAIPGSNECRAWCWIVGNIMGTDGDMTPVDVTP